MKAIISTFLLVIIAGLATAQTGSKEADRQSIMDMCGCYEVTFNFAETFAADTAYEFHENYRSGGLEWVTPVADKSDFVSLQHLLIVGKDMIVKHWRQDWVFENQKLFAFHKNSHWNYVELPAGEVQGQWTQKVYQVDDSPRYEGNGTWVHADGRHYWESYSDAPLPRREFSKRSDYNVMERRNRHELTADGWVHEQDNKKINRVDGEDIYIASEKGWNTYKKVEDSRCQAAMDWWEANGEYWADVRQVWDEVFAKEKSFTVHKTEEGKPLFTKLFALGDEWGKAEKYDSILALGQIREVINKHITFEEKVTEAGK